MSKPLPTDFQNSIILNGKYKRRVWRVAGIAEFHRGKLVFLTLHRQMDNTG